jgi:hypothetical protein
MSLGKIKTGIKQVTTMEGIPKILMHLGIGFAVGVIADWLLEAIVWATSSGKGWGRVEVGFPFYGVNPNYSTVTSIAYDDVLLMGITVIALFTKKFWLVIGFFLGWYLSSSFDLYSRIVKPITGGLAP